jgi:hypothetical protein
VRTSVRANQDWRDRKSPKDVPQQHGDEKTRSVAFGRCLIQEDQKASIQHLLDTLAKIPKFHRHCVKFHRHCVRSVLDAGDGVQQLMQDPKQSQELRVVVDNEGPSANWLEEIAIAPLLSPLRQAEQQRAKGRVFPIKI